MSAPSPCSFLGRHRNLPSCAVLALSLSALVVTPQPAAAQLSGSGLITVLTKVSVGAAVVRGTDVAYDPANGIYLVVGAHGPAYGIFVNRVGAPVGTPFFIKQGVHTQFPRLAWSPHINGTGGFLVAWTEEAGGGANRLHTRTVVTQPAGGGLYTGQLTGSEGIISDETSYAWMESGPALAYSTTSQQFLVAWKTYPSSSNPIRVRARLVDNLGQGVGSILTLSAGFGRDPGVAWNSATNDFGVSFSGESGSTALTVFARVPASNPAAFSRHTFNSFTGLSAITDIAYNPSTNRYVLAWEQIPSGSSQQARVAEIDAAGTVVGTGLASTRLGSYDALSVAFGPISGTFGLVGVDNSNDNVLAMELNSSGYPSSPQTLIASGAGAHYTRVAPSTAHPEWVSAFSSGGATYPNLGTASFVTSSTGGGPAGSWGSPPSSGSGGTGSSTCTTPQPGSDWTCVGGNWLPPGSGGGSTSSCTTPSPGTGWTCVSGNWLPPGSGGGSTSGCTTVQPGPDWTCVNGNWLPPGSTGTSGGSTSSCTTPSPGTGWTCVSGNWLPPGSGGTSSGSTSSCTTVQPGADWVCVNGNWLPPGSTGTSGGSTSSCTTPSPGTGWTCVSGNWLPPGSGGTSGGSTSTCTTVQPGPDWVCVSGNWLPPGSGSSTSTCTTIKPGPDWVCVNGNWLPPGSGGGTTTVSTVTTCTTIKPGPNWTCVNGNWLPPGDDVLLPSSLLEDVTDWAMPTDVAAYEPRRDLPHRVT